MAAPIKPLGSELRLLQSPQQFGGLCYDEDKGEEGNVGSQFKEEEKFSIWV